jgi:hypothetical protein
VRARQVFAIRFRRLPGVEGAAGLVSLTVGESDGPAPHRKVGALTDVALRGRLGHYSLHSANEIAAIRSALRQDEGQITIHEGWAGLASCLRFWHDFPGSQIRRVEWTCEECGSVNAEDVGASVGETFPRACRCGKVKRITTVAYLPAMR